jgi:hypothetical protein
MTKVLIFVQCKPFGELFYAEKYHQQEKLPAGFRLVDEPFLCLVRPGPGHIQDG